MCHKKKTKQGKKNPAFCAFLCAGFSVQGDDIYDFASKATMKSVLKGLSLTTIILLIRGIFFFTQFL